MSLKLPIHSLPTHRERDDRNGPSIPSEMNFGEYLLKPLNFKLGKKRHFKLVPVMYKWVPGVVCAFVPSLSLTHSPSLSLTTEQFKSVLGSYPEYLVLYHECQNAGISSPQNDNGPYIEINLDC